MIFLPGGPPHQDLFDLKMDAPAEVRGEFKPIKHQRAAASRSANCCR